MASNINPNNIDGAYPVAGQDNNSQGFRDNFTNIKTNLQFAANEITDLQSKVIATSQLSGGNPLEVQNNFNGQPLIGAKIRNFTTSSVALTAALDLSITVDVSAGNFQTVTLTGANTLGFSNWPATNLGYTEIALQVTVTNTSQTLNLPAAVSVNANGIQGLNTGTNTISFAATGIYTFRFGSSNNGTTITVNETNKEIQPFNASKEDLAASASANLAVTTSYFATGGAETANLAAGVEGQIKVFAMTGFSGNMVITVVNPGWSANPTGTITFNSLGDGCILMYINSKWVCIGQNGVSFA